VSAGIGAVGLGTSIYKSIKQGSEASAINKNNPRPTYQIPDEYKQNYLMAQHMAQTGIPTQQYNNQLNNINRNQAGAVGALGASANPAGGLASIVRAGDDATNKLNGQDATARQGNERYAIGQNGILGQQELAAQQYNKFDKYSENYNKAAALQGASNANLQNGINGAAGVASGLAMNPQFTGYPKAQQGVAQGDGSQTYGPYSGGYGFGNPASQGTQVNGGTINGGKGMYYNPFGNSQF